MNTKKEYNCLLKRFYNAVQFMDNNEIPISKRERYIPEFQKIMNQLSLMLIEIGEYSQNEALEGFEVIEKKGA